ncbi:MAG: sugar kinase [Planctomycetota bacterium]|nr:MAG: sugar kinase [Planctomycetota bacterium]
MTLLAGLDIGGTRIGVCLGRKNGAVIASQSFPTPQAQAPSATLSQCVLILRELQERHARGETLHAIGAAVPGPFDPKSGSFGDVPNMPRWHGFDFRTQLTELAGCPVFARNDANASMLAEALWGSAQDVSNAIFLTFSTGFGAGLWLDGRLYEGPRGLAGEIGHLRLSEAGPVGFGKCGSVEAWLSGPGIVQQAELEALCAKQRGEETKLSEPHLRTEFVFEVARLGDVAALRVIQQVAKKLGQTIAILADLFDPELVILGTIGIAHYDLLEAETRRVLHEEALELTARGLRIQPSQLQLREHRAALASAASEVQPT